MANIRQGYVVTAMQGSRPRLPGSPKPGQIMRRAFDESQHPRRTSHNHFIRTHLHLLEAFEVVFCFQCIYIAGRELSPIDAEAVQREPISSNETQVLQRGSGHQRSPFSLCPLILANSLAYT